MKIYFWRVKLKIQIWIFFNFRRIKCCPLSGSRWHSWKTYSTCKRCSWLNILLIESHYSANSWSTLIFSLHIVIALTFNLILIIHISAGRYEIRLYYRSGAWIINVIQALNCVLSIWCHICIGNFNRFFEFQIQIMIIFFNLIILIIFSIKFRIQICAAFIGWWW